KGERGNDHHLVDVGGQYIGIPTLFYCGAEDVIVAGKDLRDHLFVFVKLNAIAHRYRVRFLDPLQAELAPDTALVAFPVLTPDIIPGPCRPHHGAFHTFLRILSRYCSIVVVAPRFSRTYSSATRVAFR